VYLTACFLCGLSSIPNSGGVLQGIFPWLIILYQAAPEQLWQKMVQSSLTGTTQHMDIEDGNGRSRSYRSEASFCSTLG